MISKEMFEKLSNEVLAKRGYFVIGFPPESPRYFEIGDRTRQVMQFQMDDYFVVFEKTTAKDWREQSDLIGTLRPEWHRLPDQKGGAFFKIAKELKA